MSQIKFFKCSALTLLFLVGNGFASVQQHDPNATTKTINSTDATEPVLNAPMKSNKKVNSLSANDKDNISKRIKAEIMNAINIEATMQNKEQKEQNVANLKPLSKTESKEPKSLPQEAPKHAGSKPVEKKKSVEDSSLIEDGSSFQEPLFLDPGQEKTTSVKEQAKIKTSKKRSKKATSRKENEDVTAIDWNSSSNTTIHENNKKAKTIPGVKTLSFTSNERLNITLSNKDINRISVKGDKIQTINGPSGLYSAKNDQQGAVYINTFGETPFTVFLSTLKGHSLSLLISPNQSSGKTIVLIPASQPGTHWEGTDSYQKTLITLISHMINNAETDEYDYRELKKAKIRNFYAVAEVKTLAVYDGSYLYGTISEIKNKTKGPLTLKPSYFYEPGVRAVALLHQTIPGGSTSLIYRVIGR
jgi:conjugal transfer pilus assembly protein TraK